jgi:hypothetical protein
MIMNTDDNNDNSINKYVKYGSAIGIATAYGLDDRGFVVRVPVELIFFLPHVV